MRCTVRVYQIGDLEAQRQSLLRASGYVTDVQGDAGTARALLAAIARRDARHKALLYAIIIALLFANGLVLYLKLRRR
jgi:hypothetical protein